MNTLGVKRSGTRTVGLKNVSSNRVGSKMNSVNKQQVSNALGVDSKDGIVNYGNSSQMIYEPIKGVELPKTKRSFQLEKPQSQKSQNNSYYA